MESDARLKKLVLTEKGGKEDKAVHRTILEQEDIVFASLTEEEENQFFFLLDKLADAASNLEDRGGKL